MKGLAAGLLLSGLVHGVLLVLVTFPRPQTVAASYGTWSFRQVRLPPRVEVPPSPEPVPRPLPPKAGAVGDVEAPPDVEASAQPREALRVPEPPRIRPASGDERSALAPPEVAPMLEGRERFRRRLGRYYPVELAERGVGGVVELRFHVDGEGHVSRIRVAASSGHEALDRAARRIAGEMEFLPALSRNRSVGVWVTQRICFATVESQSEDTTFEECRRRFDVVAVR